MTGSMLSQLQALKLIMTERGCTLDEALIWLERFKAENPDGWTPGQWLHPGQDRGHPTEDAKQWDKLRATGRTVVDYPEQASCTYPACKCAFLWCTGKHPPCPITGRRPRGVRSRPAKPAGTV